ncbi:aldose 1-epimerase family protein [Fusibacillus kribbianus]|uniref:Aldose 1-epimerase family protein n=1 Tax=Fusibacillus kribbianus TaxID=3044208 RepID=A0AAP4EY47_9FIRM|nr:aldose 1-epimerase family protein [Ruminococcus sp. YH-rum2234]MDI9241466.1 aldose 1-epimerase family protein [Ruminococcus sp. YH-rum2234]
MVNRSYYGHDTQFYGVEEHRLVGGKGDGMRLFQVRNGSGLEFTVSADRAADISRISFKGVNMNYMGSAGYVAPAYYDEPGFGFLKSFNCGFLTTCGLQSIGTPSVDGDVPCPLHGTISNTPADRIYYTEEDGKIELHAKITDAEIFKQKLILNRTISCEYGSNKLTISDTVKNEGSADEPFMLLYHMNMGYPLLSEKARVAVSSKHVIPRDEHAARDLDTWDKMLAPIPNFQEQCYYHEFEDHKPCAKIFNPDAGVGLAIRWDEKQIPYMTEWKMMGERDYVLGLEPCISKLEGRAELRKNGTLQFIKPGEVRHFELEVELFDNEADWEAAE